MTYRPIISEYEVRGFLRAKQGANWSTKAGYAAATLALSAGLILGAQSLTSIRPATASGLPNSIVLAEEIDTPARSTVSTPLATPTPTLAPTIPAESISYAAVGISAPMRWNTPIDEKTVMTQLQEGVVHIKGTALPGQQGTSVLFGHSSNLPWMPGNYKNIFAPLHASLPGETIELNLNDRMFTYRVTKVFEVKPSDVHMLNATPDTHLRLITCTPIGTTLRRLVVEAELISHSQSELTPFTQENFSSQLPGD